MILDLEGTTARGAPWFALSIASATVALAVVLAVNAVPHAQLPRVLPANVPSVLERAFAQPLVPRLSLELPSELAVPLPPGRIVGDYGPGRPTPTIRGYRMR